jgi:HK97 family phage major capsid protein
MSVDESRLRELKTALQEKIAANQAIGESFQIVDGNVVVTAEHKSAFSKNMADIREIKSLIDFEEIKGGNVEAPGFSVSGLVDASAAAASSYSAKSLGEMFMDSPEFKALNGGRSGVNMPVPFEIKTHDVGSMWAGQSQKDVYTALPGGTPGAFGRTERDPLIPMQRRTARVRDLFPARSTTATIIEYFRQTGFTNAASTVAERNAGNTAFGLKPQSGLSFTGMQAPVRTIAHWEAAHRNALADEPQLRAIIDNELLYGLRLMEDAQILDGDGVGENLLGIMNSGIQTYAWSDGASAPVPDTKADAIRRAATLAYLAFYQPTGVVLHPNDYEDIELTKNTQGTYLFAVSIQDGGQARLWRMPVVETPAMTEGHALVGAFGTGAQIYDREQANIRVSESHADFFIRNAIVILAEERLALAVKRPEAFVDVTFDAAPS